MSTKHYLSQALFASSSLAWLYLQILVVNMSLKINFRGVLEIEEEYNKFLLEFNRYSEAHNVKSFADLSVLEKFLPTLKMSTRYHKNLLQSLRYCVIHDVLPLRDDVKEKSRHPE
ncbi:hypothetical protein KQX54_001027 [Cotesia glomerata]|uniref:Uncharacterized protein n=1 Tax=Cotesia glomerata TaxID=32391 RepID=A0AAV7J2J3_COTGL|nr:hypothetical protein KQX54_001027 [Cotesia glomerata]